ncbi:TetR/AcrR family transcriptional regulator [Sedimentibacter sp. zth1]|uniref:TetR/AcrR family transcriptional regulator n=1 Tax=Sedimentibacter sp. zth1 TaxID=2816908 RepID=UPI001A921ED0|nr:TetR/AcrR family transcriptional regulator [Sedimentibacter sp. zth1]QSX06919.1 TetR/AcrR family transcriptional regulator [Sedimentibacter sp. zth1]
MSQFTKIAIISSFVKLLNEYPLDKITIKDIVDDCGVNRSTFYYYFEDIYALLADLFKMEAEKTILAHKDYSSWVDGFIESIEFATKNKKAIYHVYNSLNREHLENYIYNVVDDMMIKVVKSQVTDLNVNELDIKIISDLYKYALVGMTLEWLGKGMKDDPSVIIHRMGYLFDGNIRQTLIKADNKNSFKKENR